ncbi:hypothetical protein BBJ28_00021830 [Nothophytophthora sp. Chile5]|nr:hypothetical protein BBJ28_00021830 [Nothophytophthora sp. Chile5]
MMSITHSSIALLLAVAAASSSASEAAGNLRETARNLQTYTQSDEYTSQMLELVNEQRTAQGLSSLCMNSKLLSSAARHSDDMAANNYMAHNGSDGSTMEERITEAGFIWTAVGENVAAGQENVTAVMTAWMNSPEHKANILGDYAMFGTAYAYDASTTYKHYWTQDFGTGDNEACEGSSSGSASSQTSDQTQQQDQIAGEASTSQETTTPTATTATPTATTATPTATTATPTATTATPTATTMTPTATTATPEATTATPETTAPATDSSTTQGCKAKK